MGGESLPQINMYQNVVNDVLRHPNDKPTIGLLLVKGKNETVVEYSLEGCQKSIGVAEWKDQIAKVQVGSTGIRITAATHMEICVELWRIK